VWEKIRRWTDLALARSAADDARGRRSQSVIRGTVTALAGRGVGMVVGIISVPLTIGYLGAERYGVWVTIGTFLAFLSFTDFGVANSLTNALGKAYGEERHDIAKRYVSSAFGVFCLIALLILGVSTAAVPHLSRYLFPHVESSLARAEIEPALRIAFVVFALNFPLLITNKVFSTYGENAIANLWSTAANVANLGAILIVVLCRGGLVWLVLGCSGLGLLVNIACAVWLFGFRRPALRPAMAALDFDVMKDLFSTGWKFLVIGAAWMINSETDNLVIAHYLGAAAVTPYNVTLQLFASATMLQTLAYPSLWPAYTHAFAQKDYAWIRRTFRSNFKISFAIAAVVVLFLIAFGTFIIRLWAGESAVPPFSLLIWMGVWNLMLSHLYVGSCLLNATGHLKGMTIYGTVTAVLNLALSIMLVKTYGIAGVIAATVIAFAVANYVPTFIEVRSVFRRFGD
jgi:O-antigen/teichoic acid export membrane protein